LPLLLVFEQKLSDAAFAGQVQFKGKRDSNDKTEHELIPSDYFSSHRGFFSKTGAIEPAPSWVADDAALFHEVMSDKTCGTMCLYIGTVL
jgi:hypothetical protein